MRPRSLNFDRLVQKNKNEILKDEKQISEIEHRLEKKHEDATQQKQGYLVFKKG